MHVWFWPALFVLGCYHGINPGMGWLFAVALGLQEKSTRAVLVAIPPIALGHIVSVLLIVSLAAALEAALPQNAFKYGAAAILIGFGVYRGIRTRHLRWAGMRVGFWGLALWAFLMSTGHGAGLMLLPFLAHASANLHLMNMQAMPAHVEAVPFGLWFLAVGVHTFGYLLTMTLVALVIYISVGVQILRSAWFNFDLVWAVALVVSGLLMLFL